MSQEFMKKSPARGRDIVVTAGIGALTVVLLTMSGSVAIANAVAAVAALWALSAIYYLLAGSPREIAAAPEKTESLPSPEADATAAAMVELLSDPVLLIGQGGRIERANRAARDFLGLSRDGGNIASLIRQPKVLEAITAALDGDTPPPVEYSANAPYESHVRAFVNPLPQKLGGQRLAMLLLHDETATKRAERMRADFLANASHELRTPLASLSGFIETLKGHARHDEGARDRFLSIMESQTDRMRRLINDLLSLSRIEMNEHVAPSEEVDLGKIAKDILDTLKPIAADRGVSFRLDAPETPVTVTGDRDQLMAVIQNLADNAIKYSPGGATVTVEIAVGDSPYDAIRPGGRLIEESGRMTIVSPSSEGAVGVIRVRDQGPGIERAHLPRLAQRFYRVEEGKAEDRKGTGLGLAIVKHVATRHRGGFSVESAPGRGAVFTVCAPLSGSVAPAAAGKQTAEPQTAD